VRRFGLIGYPLEHSFSPAYFKEKFAKENLGDCTYELFPLHSIHDLHPLLYSNPDIVGLNVTIPYKQLVLRQLNSAIAIPEGIRACNCIRITDGRLYGYNTDVVGFEKSLRPLLKPYHTHALVLGNGGSAEAVTYVLKNLGVGYRIVSRELHDGSTLTYQDLDAAIFENFKVVINTTPAGMYPNNGQILPLPYACITPQHLCYDLIYNPEMTRFLELCREQGAVVKNGLEMLQIQAEESWNVWNP
jgi:shikimate dehydrogenase